MEEVAQPPAEKTAALRPALPIQISAKSQIGAIRGTGVLGVAVCETRMDGKQLERVVVGQFEIALPIFARRWQSGRHDRSTARPTIARTIPAGSDPESAAWRRDGQRRQTSA